MISNPKCGWCDFKLGTFEGTPSYLTSVPVDLLGAFLSYHHCGIGTAWFDEEGSYFTLVITPCSLFIIEEKEEPILHDFSEMNIEDLAKELISDIESDFDGWVDFDASDDAMRSFNRDSIRSRLNRLKRHIEMEV